MILSVCDCLKWHHLQWAECPHSSGKQSTVVYLHLVLRSSRSHCIYVMITALSWLPCIMMAMQKLFCHCFARYLLHGYIAGLSSPFLPIFFSYHPLQTKVTLQTKHCLTAAKDAPFDSLWAPTHSLSMHGIQIISSASLCCWMEGMGVFELDLLDNMRSTQISFHARLFHADSVAHTGMLIWLLLYLRKFERERWTHPLHCVTFLV